MSALPEADRAWVREEPAPAFAGPGCLLLQDELARPFPAIEAAQAKLRAGGRPTNFALFVRVTCAAFGLEREELLGRCRQAHSAQARQALYWLCRQVTPWSLEVIGSLLARDHSAVSGGVRQAERRRKKDAGYRLLTDAMLADALAILDRRPLPAAAGGEAADAR